MVEALSPKQETFRHCPTALLAITRIITDWEQFRAFAKAYGEKTQLEMAQLWQGEISDAFGKLR